MKLSPWLAVPAAALLFSAHGALEVLVGGVVLAVSTGLLIAAAPREVRS